MGRRRKEIWEKGGRELWVSVRVRARSARVLWQEDDGMRRTGMFRGLGGEPPGLREHRERNQTQTLTELRHTRRLRAAVG